MLLSSSSDVDDLVPTLVAFQIEWNKIRARARAAGWPPEEPVTAATCARLLGGQPEDWKRLRRRWGGRFDERMALIAAERLALRMRMLGGSNVGYARLTRHWWTPVQAHLARGGFTERAAVLRAARTPTASSTSSPAWPASARTS